MKLEEIRERLSAGKALEDPEPAPEPTTPRVRTRSLLDLKIIPDERMVTPNGHSMYALSNEHGEALIAQEDIRDMPEADVTDWATRIVTKFVSEVAGLYMRSRENTWHSDRGQEIVYEFGASASMPGVEVTETKLVCGTQTAISLPRVSMRVMMADGSRGTTWRGW